MQPNPHDNQNEFKEVQLAEDPNSGMNYPGYPPQNYPPQNYPPQNYPPQNYPPQNYPPQDYPAQNNPPGYPGVYAPVVYSDPGIGYPQQPPQIILIPQQNAPIVHIAQPVQVALLEEEGDYKMLKYSRYSRIVSMVDMFFDLLIVVGLGFLFFIIAFNLLGYFGAKRFHKCMSIGFLVYLVLSILLKIIVMSAFPYPYVIGIFIVLILLQLGVGTVYTFFVVKLYKCNHSQIERLNSYHYQQPNTGFCCFYI
jgi:hypothetical protein